MARISIVLPCFNSEKHLERTIEAFQMQDHNNKQLIIVDGKSKDRSHAIIRRQLHDPSIHWLNQPDTGISNAINIALPKLADDDIFGFLGADDILLPGTLSTVSDMFEETAELHGLFFDSYSQNKNGDRRLRCCPSETLALPALLRHRTIAGLQNIYLKANLVKEFGFEENARYSMDFELYLRLASKGYGPTIQRVAKPSTININDGNISTS